MDLSWLVGDLMTQARLLITAGTAVAVAALSAYYRGAQEKQHKRISDTKRAVDASPVAELKERSASVNWEYTQAASLEQQRRDRVNKEISELETESRSTEEFARRGAGQADSTALPPLKETLDRLEKQIKEQKGGRRGGTKHSSDPRRPRPAPPNKGRKGRP